MPNTLNIKKNIIKIRASSLRCSFLFKKKGKGGYITKKSIKINIYGGKYNDWKNNKEKYGSYYVIGNIVWSWGYYNKSRSRF